MAQEKLANISKKKKKARSTVRSVFLDAFENDGMNVFEFISEAVPSII